MKRLIFIPLLILSVLCSAQFTKGGGVFLKAGSSFISAPAGPVDYCDEYDAVLAAMTTDPNETGMGYQNTLVVALKAAGVWDLADIIYVTAVHTNTGGEANINWRSPGNYTLTAPVASPVHTAYQGYRGDGTTQYLSTNYDCATNGVNVSQNSLTFSIYLRDNTATSGGCAMGTYNWSPYVVSAIFPYMSYIGNNFLGQLNQDQDGGYSWGVVTGSTGLFTYTRRGATEVEGYRDASSVMTGNLTIASLGESAVDIMILAADNGQGTIGDFLANQFSFAYIGGALSDVQVANMNTAVEAYMDSLGYGVE